MRAEKAGSSLDHPATASHGASRREEALSTRTFPLGGHREAREQPVLTPSVHPISHWQPEQNGPQSSSLIRHVAGRPKTRAATPALMAKSSRTSREGIASSQWTGGLGKEAFSAFPSSWEPERPSPILARII